MGDVDVPSEATSTTVAKADLEWQELNGEWRGRSAKANRRCSGAESNGEWEEVGSVPSRRGRLDILKEGLAKGFDVRRG